MLADNALTRFSDRVDDYIRYRPGYPPAVIETLIGEFGLRTSHVIADLGSGTGISAELFLRHGNAVYAIEPNAEMRAAAERLLGRYSTVQCINGRAEATTLTDACVDWIVAAQAFHWFDVDAARRECRRILKPNGRVVLLWNNRRPGTAFMKDYETLIHDFAIDFERINHENAEMDGRIDRFFGGAFERRIFLNEQVFDFQGVCGRVTSSSYMPRTGHPSHDTMIAEVRRLFDRHQRSGRVRFDYETKMWIGPLSGGCYHPSP